MPSKAKKDKAPKARLTKAHKDSLKAAKDHGKAFLVGFTLSANPKWPGVG
jgi:hypothetical protein